MCCNYQDIQVSNKYCWGTTSCLVVVLAATSLLVSIIIQYISHSLSQRIFRAFVLCEFFFTVLLSAANFSDDTHFTELSTHWCKLQLVLKTAQTQWCYWMTVCFKSCWYCTFSLKIKTCLSLNTTSEHPPPQSLSVSKKGSKRHKESERERQVVGPVFSLPSAPFWTFLFILPVHSVLLSIALVTRHSIHCLIRAPLPPPSISLTHPDPIPSLPAPLSSLWGPALAAIHQPDGPPLTGPPPSPSSPLTSLPLQNILTLTYAHSNLAIPHPTPCIRQLLC